MLLFKKNRSYQKGFLLVALAAGILSLAGAPQQGSDTKPPTTIKKNGVDIELRSEGRIIADTVLSQVQLSPDPTPMPVPGLDTTPNVQLRGSNTQVNDGSLDNIQIFPLFRPFVNFTQSETTVAAHNRDIVVSYNSSAGTQLVQISPGVLQPVHQFFSGFSASHDGGQTWTSGFVPPAPSSIFTFGDSVVVADRHGNFYYSTLGAPGGVFFAIQVNKSIDGGRTFGDAVVVQQDCCGDKEWIAAGPDPFDHNRDNVYVTWTSFQPSGNQIRFGRSTDGGQTWTTKTIFAPPPDPDPTHPQNVVQSSVPVVDPVTGRLYIAFTQFSLSDTDFHRILISDDAGETFRDATFNIPGAPSPAVFPIVWPGELIDCATEGGLRFTIHSGTNIGGGRFGLRRFIHASRLNFSQPAIAARNGIVYMAWDNSDSLILGDPNSHSNILFIRSDDGGQRWTSPIQVNPSVTGDIKHVLPALAIDDDPQDVHISYYTEHSDGTVDLDMANSHDRGDSFPAERTVRVTSGSSALAPTNIPLSGFATTNYNRLSSPCYNLGEYNGLISADGKVYAVWADSRRTVTEPINALDPISGQTHPQQDVNFETVKAQ